MDSREAKPNSGLRGKSKAEKQRIQRLSRSDRVIDEAEDREAVATFCRYMVGYYERKAQRQPPMWVVLILNVVVAVVLFAIGLPILGTFFAVLVVLGLTVTFISRRWEHQLLRTAAINGWVEPASTSWLPALHQVCFSQAVRGATASLVQHSVRMSRLSKQ
jgi:hypothetical protein